MFNLGIIGAGNIANEHIKVIKEIKGLNLYAITSKTNISAKKLFEKNKFKIINLAPKFLERRPNGEMGSWPGWDEGGCLARGTWAQRS